MRLILFSSFSQKACLFLELLFLLIYLALQSFLFIFFLLFFSLGKLVCFLFFLTLNGFFKVTLFLFPLFYCIGRFRGTHFKFPVARSVVFQFVSSFSTLDSFNNVNVVEPYPSVRGKH